NHRSGQTSGGRSLGTDRAARLAGRVRGGQPWGLGAASLPWAEATTLTSGRAVSWRAGVAASAPWMARARVRAGSPDRGKSGPRPTGHGGRPKPIGSVAPALRQRGAPAKHPRAAFLLG